MAVFSQPRCLFTVRIEIFIISWKIQNIFVNSYTPKAVEIMAAVKDQLDQSIPV